MKRLTHTEFKKRALARPGVKAAYDELEEEFALINELIHARKLAHKSQADVAKAMRTTTSVISRLESTSGKKFHSPSLSTLRRYAHAINCRLRVKLIPEKNHA